jgi:hypothetical protein
VKIVRREHHVFDDQKPVVRYHVVDGEGKCVPEACLNNSGLCGHFRKRTARLAAIRYRQEIEGHPVAGRRW